MTGRSRLRCRPTFLSGVAIAMASVVTLPATVAHAQDDAQLETSIVLNDSPTYAFSDGAAPTRNAPTAVVQLTGKLSDDGIEVDVTQLARFLAEDEPVSARVAFYGGRDFMVAGGVRFELTPANGPVDAEVIEREEVGTDTSPEVWDPAPDFGTATATTAGGVISIALVAKGRYRRLLRDPRTAVGLDLLPGTDGTQIQPSVRVSVGDLTGARPGLVTPQGTAVGSDDSPKPWITTPVAKDVRVVIDKVAAQHMRSFINSVNGIRLEIGDLAADAAQVRLFAAGTFTLVPANAPFPPYAIALFVPGEITAPYRVGDAYASQPVGDLVIDVQKRPGSYVLTFPATIEPDVARSVQTVLPSDAGQLVLLATGFRVRY